MLNELARSKLLVGSKVVGRSCQLINDCDFFLAQIGVTKFGKMVTFQPESAPTGTSTR